MRNPKLLAAASVLLFLTSYNLCWAHAIVVDSTPREGAVLKQAPDRIQLPPSDFSQNAPERLEVLLPPLEPGDYLLRYSVLAADGHATQGVLRFSIENSP
jgi:methionine-rich copper-binding protein CopC